MCLFCALGGSFLDPSFPNSILVSFFLPLFSLKQGTGWGGKFVTNLAIFFNFKTDRKLPNT